MVGASKILTVSYGTFSCTLEGFEEPFSTMKAIAEYFRDLAADDRYFGAEPPTPDAEMLHRIAEREIQRRVEAKVQANGIVLRAGQTDADDSVATPATANPVRSSAVTAPATVSPQSRTLPEAFAAAEIVAEPAEEMHFEDASDFSLDAVADAALVEDDETTLLDDDTNFSAEDTAKQVTEPAAEVSADVIDDGVAAKLQRIRAAIKVEKAAIPTIAGAFVEPEAVSSARAATADTLTIETGSPRAAEEISQSAGATDEYIEDIDTDDVGEFTGYTDMTDDRAEDMAADTFVEDGIGNRVEDRIAPLREVLAQPEAGDAAVFSGGTVELADETPLEDSLAAVFNDDNTEFDYVSFEKAAAAGESPAEEVSDLAALDGTSPVETTADSDEDIFYADEAADELDADDMTAFDEGDEFDGDLEGELRALDGVEDDFTQSTSSVLEAIRSSKARDADEVGQTEPDLSGILADSGAVEARNPGTAQEVVTSEYDVDDYIEDDIGETSSEDAALDAVADAFAEEDEAAQQPETSGRHRLAEDYGNDPVIDVQEAEMQPVEAITGPIFPDVNEGEDGPISRIFETTKTKLEGAENRRRFSAIAHLKAAVAATVADRKIKATHGDSDESTGVLDRYREDLAEVIRPAAPIEDIEAAAPVSGEAFVEEAVEDTGIEDLRPESERRRQPVPVMPRRPVPVQAATERPAPATERVTVRSAPLVLVSEQRVDLSGQQVAAPAPSGPVVIRPRRIASPARLEQPGIEEDGDDDAAPDQELTAEGIAKFGAFVERTGVTSLPDLLEAAAAYTSTVEGHKHFSRPQVMLRAAAVADDDGFTREAGLRSFGILLRQGKIQKVRRGQFAIASTSRFVSEANATRH
ncbi:MAG: hypothetical protein ACRCSU_06930 [Paracoccaceae bacterium]